MTISSTPISPGDHGRAGADGRRAGDRLGDVAEQLVRAAREDESLARLGDVHLHEADAAERLGESSGDLGVDRAALAEERTKPLERLSSSSTPNATRATTVALVSFQFR